MLSKSSEGRSPGQPYSLSSKVRIQAAKKELETKGANDITYGLGYENSGIFRRLFKREEKRHMAEVLMPLDNALGYI